jgi:hypothetical protein
MMSIVFLRSIEEQTMRQKKSTLKHYLLTVPLGDFHFHGYVMTANERDAFALGERMIHEMEQRSIHLFLPMVLSTKLDRAAANLVRRIASSTDPRIKTAMDTATDYHNSAWIMPVTHPDDKRLMDLH